VSTGQFVFLIHGRIVAGGFVSGEVFVGDGAGCGGEGVLLVVGEGGADYLFYLSGVEVDAWSEFHCWIYLLCLMFPIGC